MIMKQILSLIFCFCFLQLRAQNSDEKAILNLLNSQTEEWNRGNIDEFMKGYWNKKAETEDTLQNGWLRTGDIATINEGGFVKIVDRKKDMILVSGFNVYPNEIEGVIALVPGVKEVAVTNTIAIPPERRFDRLKVLSIAGLLAKAIGYTHSDQSVSSLFD